MLDLKCSLVIVQANISEAGKYNLPQVRGRGRKGAEKQSDKKRGTSQSDHCHSSWSEVLSFFPGIHHGPHPPIPILKDSECPFPARRHIALIFL